MSFMQMSITAGIMIMGIVLFRFLFLHCIPKRVMILLWGIVALRLLLPFSITSSLPGIGNLAVGCMQKMVTDTVREVMVSGVYEAQGPEITTYTTDSVYTTDTEAVDWGIILKALYFAGAGVMVLGSMYLYRKDSGLFRESLPMSVAEKERLAGSMSVAEKEQLKKIKFRISDRTATPVTYGVFRPAIVFPKGIFLKGEKEVGFCLLHELVHIKNHDNLLKLIVHGVLCIHWFNPFVWVMYFLFNRDIELLCDETAVRSCMADRQDYALALLSLAERRAMGFYTAVGFGKNAVKERILAVMTIGKITVSGRTAAVATVALAATAFLGGSVSAAAMEYVITSDIPISTAYAYTSVAAEYTDDAIAQDTIAQEAEAVSEYAGLPEDLAVSLKGLAAEYAAYGLQVQITEDDYQLYFEGEPVYFFADNRNQDGEAFSGRVFARAAGNGNGSTGVATKRDENGMVIGLVELSEEESRNVARAWTGG